MNKNTPTLKETFETARQNYSKRNFKTAETLCYKILSIDQSHFESKVLLADIFSKTGDFNKAKQLLNEATDKLFEQLKYGKVKIEIAIAKGKKHYDKRQVKKQRDWNRERSRYFRKTS